MPTKLKPPAAPAPVKPPIIGRAAPAQPAAPRRQNITLSRIPAPDPRSCYQLQDESVAGTVLREGCTVLNFRGEPLVLLRLSVLNELIRLAEEAARTIAGLRRRAESAEDEKERKDGQQNIIVNVQPTPITIENHVEIPEPKPVKKVATSPEGREWTIEEVPQ